MLFQSLSLRSDQREYFIDFSPKGILTAMLPVPISHKGRNTSYLTSAIHIAFHDVVLGVLVAF
jgi:hypothetical protein